MAWWEWLVGILMFIIALSVLVGIHELGHLCAAKMFHVYCFNYSIGFGPTIVSSKRSAKHETIWSLRAIPLGGFVAMYGEGVEMEGVDYIPPSRSLEGVARYKRAIIVSAGVFLNFILGFILIFSHNAFFPHISFSLYNMSSIDTQYAHSFIVNTDDSLGIKKDSALKFYIDPLAKVSISNNQTTSVFFLASDIHIEGAPAGTTYVLCFKNVITTTKVDPDISLSFDFYKQITSEEQINKAITNGFTDSTLKSIIVTNENLNTSDKKTMEVLDNRIKELSKNTNERNSVFKSEAEKYYNAIKGTSSNAYSIDTNTAYKVSSNTPTLDVALNFYEKGEDEKYTKETKPHSITIKPNANKNAWDNTGIRLRRNIKRYTFAESLKASGQEWCTANSTIFTALGQIFSGNVKNVGGIIAIANQSSRVLSGFGLERYLYLWGMISCNLAIINLLPIPGLDGWTLLVTAYEGITKKQIPTKIKNIVSLIGLVFVFSLMILIIIKDIIGLL